jgi:ubiquinone/menaquinone biosynthesis C-methylase UbiE
VAKTGATYDRFARHYDRVIGPLDRRFLSRLRAQTLQHIPPDSRVLEVGAGTGMNFPHYPHGTSGVASELSCEMLKIAGTKERGLRVSLIQCNAESLPFADSSFDAAFATLVFCSIPSPERALAEIRRVVRPGGIVALLEHVRPKNLLGPVFDLINLVTVPLFDDHFNRRTSEAALRAGLKPISIGHHAFGIVQVIVCRA